jgi:hypothetical protein
MCLHIDILALFNYYVEYKIRTQDFDRLAISCAPATIFNECPRTGYRGGINLACATTML